MCRLSDESCANRLSSSPRRPSSLARALRSRGLAFSLGTAAPAAGARQPQRRARWDRLAPLGDGGAGSGQGSIDGDASGRPCGCRNHSRNSRLRHQESQFPAPRSLGTCWRSWRSEQLISTTSVLQAGRKWDLLAVARSSPPSPTAHYMAWHYMALHDMTRLADRHRAGEWADRRAAARHVGWMGMAKMGGHGRQATREKAASRGGGRTAALHHLHKRAGGQIDAI